MTDWLTDGAVQECPVCSSSIKHWRSKQATGQEFNIDRCVSCGFAFVNPRPGLDFLKNFYSASGHTRDGQSLESTSLASVMAMEQHYPNSTLDARRMIGVLRTLMADPGEQRLLDVGCGYGFFSREALDAGFHVVALELADIERGIAKELAGVDPVQTTFEDLDRSDGSFDAILMSQILEHAVDVNLWIDKASSLLSDEGVIAIALPNFGSIFRVVMQENETYICPPAHLNFSNAKNLSLLLRRHGFEVVSAQSVSRLPLSTFERRLPPAAKPVLPALTAAAAQMLRLIDKARLGMVVNVYARKVGPVGPGI